MSHAQRFDTVGAQRGTPLHEVVSKMKEAADLIEQRFDANHPQVVSAMQRLEMGLNLLKGAPETEQADAPESGDDGGKEGESGDSKPATRRKPTKKADEPADAG